MPSKEEKQRRRQIGQTLTSQERVREEASLPLSKAQLRTLLDTLDNALAEDSNDGASGSCDHTLSRTQAFLTENSLPQDGILDWLRGQGGYCDCEVLANVGEIWADRLEAI